MKRTRLAIISLTLAAFVAGPALAQAGYAPPRGRSIERQQADVNFCRNAAIDISGFNPATAVPPVKGGKKGRENLKGAAIGAAGGAVLGEVIGDRAGIGALAGGAAGVLGGQIKKRRKAAKEEEIYRQELAAYEAAHVSFDNSFGACMIERGYTQASTIVTAY
ncbi:MAG TPA: hypothetical protein DCZ49_00460 [Hyphomonadaceae bacterium]|nr:hypothetical protein [Hyphomonadaceae bacterium]